MRARPCGRDGLLLEFASSSEVGAAYRALRAARDDGAPALAGVTELVPAARTVLVVAERTVPRIGELRALLDAAATTAPAERPGDLLTLPVHYDGADLDLVAQTAGLTTDEVVALHTGAEYTVAFCGFAPGFGYLVGLPGPLRQSRLAQPRTAVPAGAVGVAGEFTGVYPRRSPGGWRLLGRTDSTLFDPDRDPPALLVPGTRVRFEAVR